MKMVGNSSYKKVNKRVVIIDNYDSFSYNLYQYFGEFADEVIVVKNDEYSPEQIERKFKPTHIVLSPGPCRPDQAGITEEAVLYFAGKIPILGVCLGHQGICEALGGKVVYAKKLMHGKSDIATLDTSVEIFKGLPKQNKVARYHSLAVANLPSKLRVIATTQDGEIMGVKHNDYNIFGVQFHPESIMTDNGKAIINNFLNITEG
jgi:anthranilate synthase component 2